MSLLRRIAVLETARQRDVPGPGLSGLLRWAATHQPDDQWWQELTEIVATSPYRPQLEEQSGLVQLLAEAQRWQRKNQR
jgi:hypothetical protein